MKRKNQLLIAASVGLVLTVGCERALAQRPIGVDVYEGTGTVNWSSAKSGGISFAYAKATEGTYYQDPYYTENMSNGKGAGVLMGGYHFARPDLDSPGTEENYFWSFAKGNIGSDGKTLMPMLDYETFAGVTGASSYADWANQYCDDLVSDAQGAGFKVRPVIYISACNACELNSSDQQWIPWIANYNGESAQTGGPWTSCSSCDIWNTWDIWQFTSSGSVPGISGSADMDAFNGAASDLQATLVIGGATPAGSDYSAFVGPIQENADGRLEMFGVGANTDIWHDYQTAANSGWNGWIDLANGNSIAGPAVSHDQDGRLEAFASTGSGKVWHNYQTIGGGGAWNGWSSFGGPGVTNLFALTNLDGRIELFGIGTNQDVWHIWQTSANGSWETSWADITGEHIKGGVVGAMNTDGRLEIFGVGQNGDVWHNWQTSAGQAFNGWADMGASSSGLNSRLAIAQNTDGRLELFGLDSGGNLWHDWQTSAGQVFNGWIQFGGPSGLKPGMAVGMNSDGRLELFVVGSNTDVWHTWQDEPGTRWSNFADLGNAGTDPQLVVANNANGAIQVFGIGSNDDVWSIYQIVIGGSWGTWFDLGNNGLKFYRGQP